MPTEDYTAATTGTLKLKGVQSSRVKKHKRKLKRPNPSEQDQKTATPGKGLGGEDGKVDVEIGTQDERSREERIEKALADELSKDDEPEPELHDEEEGGGDQVQRGIRKTEAERRHEERRRKRV